MNITVNRDIYNALEIARIDTSADSVRSVVKECIVSFDKVVDGLQNNQSPESKAIIDKIKEITTVIKEYFDPSDQTWQLTLPIEYFFAINVAVPSYIRDKIEFVKVGIVYSLHNRGYIPEIKKKPKPVESKLVPNKGDYVPSFGVSADVKEALNSYMTNNKCNMRTAITDFVVHLGSVIATTTKENQELGGDVVKNLVIRKLKDIKQVASKFMVSKRAEQHIDFNVNIDSLISSDYSFYFTQNDFLRTAVIYGLYDHGYLPKLNLESLKPINNQYSGAVSPNPEPRKIQTGAANNVKLSMEDKKFKYLADGLEKDLAALIIDYIAMNEDKPRSKRMAISTFNKIIDTI
ncbi:MAG: hypothetical protein LBC41_18590 [Clostridiales bacterium]|nr:hypothetical protein [Clostridiales bacterium]MDR2752669.1 hypothetical protein [Clostridiales bacterium]